MSQDLFDLTGRLALVTGAGRGIGFALARGLGQAGAALVLNDLDGERLDAAVAELRSEGLTVDGRVFDVTSPEQVEAAIAAIEAEVGALDILVNNAGVQHRTPLEDLGAEAWRNVLDTNLTSVFLVGQAVGRRMIARGRGKIVNIGSIQSEVARPGIAAYTAAKGGVRNLTRAMCADWARHGIQVNAIGPGYFVTPLTQALHDDEAFDAWLRARTPAGRWGQVGELVGAAVFLASSASDFVNGQVIYVDGGILAVI
jgi:gluconate 5-dehydrogenase